MGLSASQARLLSITARLSDNELHSQQIANAKVRLADQSQEASREYVNALDAQKLMYTMYDAKGNATKVNLTPAVLYEFSELKNQYGISNTSGQLLISSSDALHYKNSANLTEFLKSYGVQYKPNEEYENLMNMIYGDRHDLYDSSDPYKFITQVNESLKAYEEGLNNITVPPFTLTKDSPYDAFIVNKVALDGNEYTVPITQDDYEKKIIDYYSVRNTYVGLLELEEELGNIYSDIMSENPQYSYGDAFELYVSALYNAPKPDDFYSPASVESRLELLGSGSWDSEKQGPLDEAPENPLYELPENPLYEEPVWEGYYSYDLESVRRPGHESELANIVNDADELLGPNQNVPMSFEELYNIAKGGEFFDVDQLKYCEQLLAQFVWSDGYSGEGTIMADDYILKNNNTSYWGLTDGGADKTNYPNKAFVDTNNIQELIDQDSDGSIRRSINVTYLMIVRLLIKEGELSKDVIEHKKGYEYNDSDLDEGVFKDLYLDIVSYNFGITVECLSIEKIKEDKKEIYDRYLETQRYIDTQRYEVTQQYKEDCVNYAREVQSFLNQRTQTWLSSVKYLQNNYKALLDLLNDPPPKEVMDETDPKAQWYVNLWHRINGPSDENVNIKLNQTTNEMELDAEATSGIRWKILDDASLKSASWLQYALEQGIVTIEQVQKADDIETETGLTKTKWQSKVFTSCTDIQFVDDQTAVARAEAIYTKKLNEIEAKDKKYDNDMKKLDTEHTALKTEYDSVKEVVNKNIDRSFKAFS